MRESLYFCFNTPHSSPFPLALHALLTFSSFLSIRLRSSFNWQRKYMRWFLLRMTAVLYSTMWTTYCTTKNNFTDWFVYTANLPMFSFSHCHILLIIAIQSKYARHLFFNAMVCRVARPQNSPNMKMQPTNDNNTIRKYLFDGETATWAYNSPKFSGIICWTNWNYEKINRLSQISRQNKITVLGEGITYHGCIVEHLHAFFEFVFTIRLQCFRLIVQNRLQTPKLCKS